MTEQIAMSIATRIKEPPRAGDVTLRAAVEPGDVTNLVSERKELDGYFPQLQLPTDYPRLASQTFRSATRSVSISTSLSEAVKAMSEREGVAPFATLLAAFEALLYRYSGQADFALGAVAGHRCPETQKPTASFIYTVVLSAGLSGETCFRDLMRRAQCAVPRASSPANVPFEAAKQEPQSTPDPSHRPIPKVFFSLSPKSSVLGSDRALADTAAASCDLYAELTDGAEGIYGRIYYNADLFEAATIARMVGHWQMLLEGAVDDPGQRLSALPLLSEAEQRMLMEWNDTRTDYPAMCLHELIARQVERTPDAVAVAFDNEELSYRDLNSRANQLAHYLRRLGVGPDVLVGICLERSLAMVVGLLGILKAGGAYVPLDPEYPIERLIHMVEDSELKVLLTQGQLRSRVSQLPAQLICLDSLSNVLSQESFELCDSGATPENLAYVIYTSGSTGKPKGVQISHRSLVNFLASVRNKPGMTDSDILLAVTTISFDIAGLELYLPLTVGAQVVLASRETAVDGERLGEKLATCKASCMQATPATWRLLLESGWKGHKNLKILCGGEAVPRDLVNELKDKSSSIWNMYGPTETTIWSTIHEITASDGPVSIGRPIANTQIWILDKYLQPVPAGVPGELYIGGDGLARGYLNRPQLTAERFITDPFQDGKSGARLYRTGDLARWQPDGTIECLGRVDNQVKIRGFRIELGEIEAALSQHPAVSQNVVVARESVEGDKLLVAYIVPAQKPAPTINELRNLLKSSLPDYMIPSRFMFLEVLPLTPNRKVDRKALPMHEPIERTQRKGYVAPRNSLESQLAKIWESVLNVRPVGLRDNFFELGGHSLLVAKLLRRIEQGFGKKLSLASVFQAPTLERLASMLRNNSGLQWPPGVVPIQPGGSKPPFFCFGYGAGPVFLPLSRRLGSNQPVLGVDPTLLDTSRLPIPCAMEDIAAYIAKQIRKLQSDGPYYLGGVCGGGLMAYETASQLVAQGQRIALLALFEPHTAHHDYFVVHSTGFGPSWMKKRLKFHWENLRQLQSKETKAYIRDHMRERSRVLRAYLSTRFWNMFGVIRSQARNGRLRSIRNTLGLAYQTYRPRPFAGPVLLFQATRREPGSDWEREYWQQLASNLEVQEVPGCSNWLVRFFMEPSVEILADGICGYLPDQRRVGERG